MGNEEYYNEALKMIKEKMSDLGMDYDINLRTVAANPFNIDDNLNYTYNTEEKVTLKVINKSNNEDPSYKRKGDSGFDLRAFVSEPVTIPSLERCLINTGIYVEIPEGYEIQVRPRSGLALKNGITVLNTPGTVDSNYRGEICIILANLGKEDFVVENGDRVAQAVLAKVTACDDVHFEITTQINETERNEAGFGSSGVK